MAAKHTNRFGKLIRKINFYPPYLFSGVKVTYMSEDFRRFELELRPRWYNRNLFGTAFGGSLYGMCDPFFVFIIAMNLGPDYIVWDKSATVDFLKPARGKIRAVFEIEPEKLEAIQAEVDKLGKNTYHFEVDLTDEEGIAVARIGKEIYVRNKTVPKPASDAGRE